MPAFDQRLAVGVAGFWRIDQIIRCVAVHHHLASDHAQIKRLRRTEKRLHRFFVHAAEHQRRGGAVAQQFLDEDVRHLGRMLGVGELAFAGEGVGVQPVQQLLTIRADHAGLRQVNVRVDEAWRDQRVLILDQLHVTAQAAQQVGGMAQRNDLAILDQQQAVGEIFIRRFNCHFSRVGNAVNDGGAVGLAVGY
ncbi:hypothetical protein ALP75_201291 [Pseudomonas syringae pv. actinidiae]|nr:hypothetical protein ALP75_201291 [Pseudomonas syringae pv. actinidiae]